MMRALWTASSGMKAQQMNVDVISNNLANVSTTSYKKQRVEFKDLLYETLSKASVVNGGTDLVNGKPVNLQVGYGVNQVATVSNYSTGNMEKTDNSLDFSVDGEGFFEVMNQNGEKMYTRDGGFKVSINNQVASLVTSEGYPVMNTNDQPITFDGFDYNKISVGPTGEILYPDPDGNMISSGQTIRLARFQNREGLLKVGSNYVMKSAASGDATYESDGGEKSALMQGYLEASNVQVVEEMVKLIVAQRAYEINSKSVQAADEMLGIANGLRR